MGLRVHGIVLYVGSGSASARLQVALREVEQHVVHLRGLNSRLYSLWIRWVKAGLVAQAVMWRPSCVAHRHGWAQLGVVLVVHLERGTVSVTATVERHFSLLDHVHLARVR